MAIDLWALYRQMLKSRLFEQEVKQLWQAGLISGEMHLGTGEEAIVAGVLDHLSDGDALALDHRGTPPLVMRGVDLTALLREFLGQPDGLCKGMGGHMHLFSPEHLAASSGIVGASGPAAVGFALANSYLRPDKVAVAFFGEGAANQGMLMEAWNLAATWKLPVLFVCKNSQWAITSRSAELSAGTLTSKARGFGLPVVEVDGGDVEQVWRAAGKLLASARRGEGPGFLHARCVHLDGHFLGDPLLRAARRPAGEMPRIAGPLLGAVIKRQGVPLRERLGYLATVSRLSWAVNGQTASKYDPLRRARRKLQTRMQRLSALEDEVTGQIQQAVLAATRDLVDLEKSAR